MLMLSSLAGSLSLLHIPPEGEDPVDSRYPNLQYLIKFSVFGKSYSSSNTFLVCGVFDMAVYVKVRH